VDVAYGQGKLAAAALAFPSWEAAEPAEEVFWLGEETAPYVPGQLAARELPALLAVLAKLPQTPQLVLVDGYVFLDAQGRLGLGGRLFQALRGQVPVVGVAKKPFAGAPAVPLFRGKSKNPLWVSAAGVEPLWAAERVACMHGPFRLPTLLRWVDRSARAALVSALTCCAGTAPPLHKGHG
jgi:deoxyribonuclease V